MRSVVWRISSCRNAEWERYWIAARRPVCAWFHALVDELGNFRTVPCKGTPACPLCDAAQDLRRIRGFLPVVQRRYSLPLILDLTPKAVEDLAYCGMTHETLLGRCLSARRAGAGKRARLEIAVNVDDVFPGQLLDNDPTAIVQRAFPGIALLDWGQLVENLRSAMYVEGLSGAGEDGAEG